MSVILFVVGWLACSVVGFLLIVHWWRRNYDLELRDALFFAGLFLLEGPFGVLIGLGFVIGALFSLPNGDRVVLPRKQR